VVKSDQPVASRLDVIEGASNETIYTQPGVDIPLQTGGSLTFDLADSRTKNPAYFFSPAYTPDFSASISQPLLRVPEFK